MSKFFIIDSIIAFYIPRCSAYDDLEDKIRRNGGMVIEQCECNTIQIKPDGIKTGFTEYFPGKIYSSRLITESIKLGKFTNIESFYVAQNIEANARRLNIGKKKKYTILEGIKLYELTTNQKNLSTNST